MCGAPPQTPTLPPNVDISKETVIYGIVSLDEAPVPGAYVRLLNEAGDFVAEVVTSATGDYRFFAAPGRWTLSVLHRDGAARKDVVAEQPGLVETRLSLS
jgi:hypothetical protein